MRRLRDGLVGAYFLPYITSTVAIAIMFSSLFSTDYGLVNALLERWFGVGHIDWLQGKLQGQWDPRWLGRG